MMRLKRALIPLGILCSLLLSAQTQSDTITRFRGVEEHWRLAFADEFNGQAIDESKWIIADGVLRDPAQAHSQQWFDPKMAYLRDGRLVLEVRPDTLRERSFRIWVTDKMEEMKGEYSYIAGEIDSREKFFFGMYEIRCRLPKGRGLWPAFWIYGEQDGVNNEIDVFEFWNQRNWLRQYDAKRLSRVQNMSVHHRGRMSIRTAGLGPDYSAGFHVFSVIWDDCTIRWYTDGRLVRLQYRWPRMKGRRSDCASITDGGKENVFPQAPGQVILDIAVQNGDGSPDDTNVWPQTMEVDYFRYYERVR